ETRRENERPDFFVRRVLIHRETLRHGLLEDLLAIQATAVVAHLDHDLPAMMLGGHRDGAFGVLADFCPTLGRFDAMVDTVAHQVREWIDNALDQTLVELGGRRSEEHTSELQSRENLVC